MSKTIVVMGTVLLSLILLCVTALALLGKDPSVIVTFAASTLIPAASVMYVGQKVEKAGEAAEQAVTNTNGRMTELIENNALLSQQVAELSARLPPSEAVPIIGGTTDQYAVDENGKPYLHRDL